MLNVGGWCSSPISEARGALGTIPIGLRANLYLHPVRPPPKRLQLFYHIIPSLSSAPTLIYLYLRHLPPPPPSLSGCLPRPDTHDIQGGLLQPSPG